MSGPAPIPAVRATETRPWLSVMIPTWCPEPAYLEEAVQSVLTAQPADADVQVTLVDDASPDFDPSHFARRFPAGSVAVVRHADHRGLASNWNAALAAARGRWVHLLHQDDFVSPGFYAALHQGIEREPTVAAAFCASRLIDATGDGWTPRLVPMATPGILTDWPRHVFARLSIQCSAIIVRRDLYETLGGFDPDYRYAPDWDMWRRIAARHPIWYHPDALASYRMHPHSETARQSADGSHLVEIFRSIERTAALLPPAAAPRVLRQARFNYAGFAIESALAVWRSTGRWSAVGHQLGIARQATSTPTLLRALATVAARSVVRRLTPRGG